MLERIKNALQERKRDDKGFSLVELAVVIVIIGILVAIAVPVFMGIQDGAKKAAVEAAAANGAAQVAAALATDPATVPTLAASAPFTFVITPTGTKDVSSFCVTATGDGFKASKGTASGCNAKASAAVAPPA